MAQQLLYAPEAARCKDGGLGVVVHGVVFPPMFRSGPAGIGTPSGAELMMISFAYPTGFGLSESARGRSGLRTAASAASTLPASASTSSIWTSGITTALRS